MPKITQHESQTGGVQAVFLSLKILELLAFGDRPGRVTDLAKSLGTTKNRIHRHLQTLQDLGYVVQDPDTDQYRVGIRLVQLGNAVANQYDLLTISRPVMRRLRDRFGHTVVLSKVDNDQIYAIERVDGRSNVTVGIVIGSPLGLNSSAQGKIALAFGLPSLIDALVERELEAVTPYTIVDPVKLRKAIAEVRVKGWATAPNETLTGINAFAVPIFDGDGELFATLALLASVDELPGNPNNEKIAALKEAANEISATLYGTSFESLERRQAR